MVRKKITNPENLHPITKSVFSESINKRLLANYDEEKLQRLREVVIENLNAMLREWHLNKSDLSVICKISKPSVSQWFNRNSWPRMGNLILLAKRINRNPISFFKKDGIHIDKPDGGFPKDVYFETTDDKQIQVNAQLIRELYEIIGSDTGINLEKESLDEVSTTIGPLTKSEKALIANWRLLTPTSQAFILHNIYLEARYSQNMYKRNNDDIPAAIRGLAKSQKEKGPKEFAPTEEKK